MPALPIGQANARDASAPPHLRGDVGPCRAAVGGLPYFGRKMAALLDGDGWRASYLETRGWRPLPAVRAVRDARRAGVLYQVGGQIGRFSRPHALLTLVNRPCVMQWTGSDVLYARATVARGGAAERLRRGVTHWAGAPWLVDELAAIGVRAEYVPHSFVEAPARLPEFPAAFTVLAYIRAGRETFYGAGAVLRAAAALPDARFLVAGCDRLDGAPPNVRCLGWVEDMAAVYARVHVLLRMTAHDGLAFMVQEALAHGRYAVWNHPFPGTDLAASDADACACLVDLAARHRTGALALNMTGAEHIAAEYNPRRVRDDIRRRLRTIAECGMRNAD